MKEKWISKKFINYFKRKSIKLLLLFYLIMGSSWLFFPFDKIDILILIVGSVYYYKMYTKEAIKHA